MIESYQGIEDSYLPTDVKPSLQQYDNYQIYDIYLSDAIYSPTIKKIGLIKLAVQKYSPLGVIDCDFNSIANLYP